MAVMENYLVDDKDNKAIMDAARADLRQSADVLANVGAAIHQQEMKN